MISQPSDPFVQNVTAAVAYWQKATLDLDDETIRQIDVERQNFLQAIKFGLALPKTWEVTTTVMLQVADLVEWRGYWQEWITLLKQALVVCPKDLKRQKFKLLNSLGKLHRLSRKMKEAIAYHQEAETIAQQLHDAQLIAETHFYFAEVYLRQHDYAQAEQYGLAALTQLADLKYTENLKAGTLNALGEAARFRGDLMLSEERLSQAVTIRRQLEHTVPLARALNNLACARITAKKFDAAAQGFKEVANLLAKSPYELDKVMVQINLGLLYFSQKRWAKAEAALRQADSNYLRQSGNIHYRAITAQSLGNVLLMQGRLPEADVNLRRAIALWQQTGDELELANSLETLGELFVAQGKVEAGITLYLKAIALLKKFPDSTRAQRLLHEFEHDLQQLTNKAKA